MADDTLRAAITTALAENGVSSWAPSGIHSWRCEYPDLATVHIWDLSLDALIL